MPIFLAEQFLFPKMSKVPKNLNFFAQYEICNIN